MRVLLVEDDSVDILLVEELLNKCPGSPFLSIARTLEEGLKALETNRIDVVLLDLGLPDTVGLSALEKILEKHSDVPIVVMTGHADESVATEAVHLGAQDYLIKGQVNSDLLRRSLLYSIERKKLANALKQRTTELEVINKGLEAFNEILAHDLRAPLQQIDGYIALLEEGGGTKLNDSSKRYLKRIRERSVEMEHILEDLRSLSRFGGQELHFQTCDLNLLVEEAVRDVTPQLGNRLIEWRIAGLPKVACDPASIQQVMFHLLSNALKFTIGSNPAVIEIGQMTKAEEITVYVRDNGLGFSMGHSSRLFHLFQSLHGRSDFPGIGIGLVIVQQIVNRHGGRVWAEAEPGKGATFYFTLPPAGDPELKLDTLTDLRAL